MLPFLRRPFSRRPGTSKAAFVQWLASPDGARLLDAEQQELDELLPGLVGCRALQLGVDAGRDLLATSQLPFKWRLASGSREAADLQVYPASLPLPNACVDLVLLHHCLDFDDDPYRILGEATRVLNPGGSLLVVGFNPVSLFGFRRLFHAPDVPPWSGRFLRAGRVSDWAGVCGCELLGYASGFYGQRNGRLWEWLGHRLWQRFGGFYVLLARKQAIPLQPLLQRRRLLIDIPANVISVPAARWQRTGSQFESSNDLQ